MSARQAWRTIADATRDEHRRFVDACARTEQTQQAVLAEIVSENAASTFGTRADFSSIDSVETYRRRVPISTYDDLADEVHAQARGEPALCAQPVRFYEQTGGSTGGSKLVPYTDSALRALQRAVEPWLADLIAGRPAVTGGPGYWSISPAARAQRHTADGTPIGSATDLAFMRECLRASFAATLATPPELARVTDLDRWRSWTQLTLLLHEDLRLLSVWSPSFLTTLLASLADNAPQLQRLLTQPGAASELPAFMGDTLGTTAQRHAAADRLDDALDAGALNTQALWPRLDTLSCWTHGAAAGQARDLAQQFAHAHLQPKGLLATECVVSIPVCAAPLPVLAVRSGFFEFLDDDDHSALAHELAPQRDYRLVVTTFSGHYRYDLGDTVRMGGTHNGAPLLEFVGRHGTHSDLCGEKLTDAFVARCLAPVFGFALLAPVDSGYCLFVDSDRYSADELAALTAQVDKALAHNPQYAYAQRLGQLAPLTVHAVRRPEQRYLRYRAQRGQSVGDIKPAALCTDAGVRRCLARDAP